MLDTIGIESMEQVREIYLGMVALEQAQRNAKKLFNKKYLRKALSWIDQIAEREKGKGKYGDFGVKTAQRFARFKIMCAKNNGDARAEISHLLDGNPGLRYFDDILRRVQLDYTKASLGAESLLTPRQIDKMVFSQFCTNSHRGESYLADGAIAIGHFMGDFFGYDVSLIYKTGSAKFEIHGLVPEAISTGVGGFSMRNYNMHSTIEGLEEEVTESFRIAAGMTGHQDFNRLSIFTTENENLEVYIKARWLVDQMGKKMKKKVFAGASDQRVK
jgi:hypothetical protein